MVDTKTQNWIKRCECLELHTYIDTTGHLTVGWGRNLENGISVDEAELMFQNDLKRAVHQLEQCKWYNIQPQNVKDALINMNFNLGIHKLLEFKEMIAALENKDYTLASTAALNSLWAKQVGERAKDVALMMRQG
jgi:lysozyme